MKRVTYIIALVLVLTASAMAQRADDGVGSQGIKVQIGFGADGVETSRGTFDLIDNKFWGNTFALNGSNRSETYQFTISMDYLQSAPGQDNNVTGGSWTLAVYKNGIYSGMLFGEIVGGYITWKTDREGNTTSRYTAGKISVTGGTDTFEGVSEGVFGGVFSATSEVGTRTPKVTASVEIGF